MRYEITHEKVTFYLDNPKRHLEHSRTTSFEGTGLSASQITPMLDSIVLKYRGSSLKSQNMAVHQLGSCFAGFRTIGSAWPNTSQDWNFFILRYFQFYLTDTNYSQAKVSTRVQLWSTHTLGLLSCLKDSEVIPLDVVIPLISKKKVRSIAKDQPLLGHSGRRLSSPTEPAQKLLVDISFGMKDADYLDAVEKKCRHLVNVVKDVALTHWNGLMQDIELGRRMAAQVTDADVDTALAERRFGERITIPGRSGLIFTKYASPCHPQGLPWALASVRHTLKTSSDIHCVSMQSLRESPFWIRNPPNKQHVDALRSITSMTSATWEQLTSLAKFYRFTGLLSPLDMAAACLLLTIEHPQFPSESLQNAVLLNVRGKPRLLVTDNKSRSIFYLDKPRAKQMKSAALSDLAQKVLLDIVHSTSPVRDVLKRAGDKTWRYLFLGAGTRGHVPGVLSALDAQTKVIAESAANINLTRLYPVLAQNGLEKGNFDYRRLRNTLGIIKWFETGSILEMSRTLGNTRRVALDNYLPPALLHAWNTRIIRRFQNTLIVLAAHEDSYLLEVTDFSNLADLQHFIAQLILDYPAKTSPLADEVQRLLGCSSFAQSDAPTSPNGFLNVRLSSKSLAHLYAFRDLALTTLSDQQQDKIDTLSGLSPRQFINMAQLLTHAAENTELHPSLRERMDVTRLVEIHSQALALKERIDVHLTKLTITPAWEVA
jgi:hypothetical protein